MGHPDDALAVLESDPNPEKDYDSLEPAQADVMASSSDQVPPATGTIKATAVQVHIALFLYACRPRMVFGHVRICE